ncbi:hypothetical protein D3C78_1554230 [compost metagenome]
MFGWLKRRRAARLAAAEQARQGLRDRLSVAVPVPGRAAVLPSGRASSSSSSSSSASSVHVPLHPLNPINQPAIYYAEAPRRDPEPVAHCAPSVSDDSWGRSSSSSSCSGFDSSSYSSSDSSSSSSSSDSSY